MCEQRNEVSSEKVAVVIHHHHGETSSESVYIRCTDCRASEL